MGKFPHLDRWFNHIGSVPVLQDLLEKYNPKRNNARKKQVAETIKERKADPKTASVRHTGTHSRLPSVICSYMEVVGCALDP